MAEPSITHTGEDYAIHIMEPLCAVFRRKLKGEGLKYTPERARILDAIVRAPEPFTVDQVIAMLEREAKDAGASASLRGSTSIRTSKATVYRTIKLLAEAGIIQQVLFQAEHAHYQLVYGRASTGLLVRTDTHEIEPIDVPELDAIRDRLCRERGLEAHGHRLVIFAVGPNPTTETRRR